MTIIRRYQDSNASSSQTDFSVTDSKGREFGIHVNLWERNVVEREHRTFTIHDGTLDVGKWFACCCQTTRAGVRYGACQPEKFFRTNGERAAYVLKRIEQARKNAKPGKR